MPSPTATREDDRPGLVEAVLTPPPHAWIGPEGQRLDPSAGERIRWLGGVLGRVRAASGAALTELVVEAERALGLDVELAARPEHRPEEARVHLDAFGDAAASFHGGAERPTLGGFLAWLDAATTEEHGLDIPVATVSAAAVQILTVHAAKGLEWDVVAIPGMVEGTFPSTSAAVSTFRDGRWTVPAPRDKGWCVGLGSLPYELRGDADALPRVDWRSAQDGRELGRAVEEFFEAGGERIVRDERRLAYVALTRARHHLLLTSPVWTDATTPRLPSRFVEELLGQEVDAPPRGGVPCGATAAATTGGTSGLAVSVGPWTQLPSPDALGGLERPAAAQPARVEWPTAMPRAQALEEAAQLVQECLVDADAKTGRAEVIRGAAAGDPYDRELLALLAERDAIRAGAPEVDIPGHMTASGLVALARDEAAFARDLRRPVPRPPADRARDGHELHAWIEGHYRFADTLDLHFDSQDPGGTAPDADAARSLFLRSEWADRVPLEVELPVEATIGGTVVRGRIDAVFADPEPPYLGPAGALIVDWKSRGQRGRNARAVAVQLATYRLAYARLRGMPPHLVRAAYYDASSGQTIYPELPSEDELADVLGGVLGGVAGASRGGSPGSASCER